MANVPHTAPVEVAAPPGLRTILVPLDGSDLAERSLEPALELARLFGSQLGLLTVEPLLSYFPLAGRGPDVISPVVELRRSHSELAQRYLDALTANRAIRDVPLWTCALRDDPGRAILDCLEEKTVDLLVMTSHNRGGLSRWWWGSVADEVLTRTRCPVLILPPETTECPCRKLLVPLDGSEFAERALPLAEILVHRTGGELLLMRARSLGEPVAQALSFLSHGYQESYQQTERERCEQYLEEKSRSLGERGFRAATRYCDESAVKAILETAREEHADLIVMTTHGRGGWDRLSHGSIAYKVRLKTPLPLLLVPLRPATA